MVQAQVQGWATHIRSRKSQKAEMQEFQKILLFSHVGVGKRDNRCKMLSQKGCWKKLMQRTAEKSLMSNFSSSKVHLNVKLLPNALKKLCLNKFRAMLNNPVAQQICILILKEGSTPRI